MDEERKAALWGAVDDVSRVLDAQFQTTTDIDRKASKLLRLSLILIGAGLSILTIVVKTDSVSLAGFLNPLSFTALVFIIASIIVSAINWQVTRIRPGLSAEALRTIVEEEDDEAEFLTSYTMGAADWIESNKNNISQNSRFFSLSVLLLIDGLLTAFFALLIAVAVPWKYGIIGLIGVGIPVNCLVLKYSSINDYMLCLIPKMAVGRKERKKEEVTPQP